MKRFNLVPDSSDNAAPERRSWRGESKDKELIAMVVPIILSVAVVFFLHTTQSSTPSTADPLVVKKYNALKKEFKSLALSVTTVGDVASLTQERDRLKTNLQRLKGLTESKKIPIDLLVAISNNISERVALTVINKQAQTVSVEGIAQDNESLSDFIEVLVKEGVFRTVNLKLTKYSDDYGPYKQMFVMECIL